MRIWAAMAAMLCLAYAPGAQAGPVDTGHLEAELVSQAQGIAPGATIHVALRQKIDRGWHTYWRNSGDSGEATRLVWTLPAGWKAGEIIWPTPHRQPTGPLMNYGYTGEVLLPVALTAPRHAGPGQSVTLEAKAAFLVCADICVPEDATLKLTLPVVAAAAAPDPQFGAAIAQTVAAAPKPAALTAAFEARGGGVKLAIAGAPLAGADMADAYFYPFASTVIDHAKPQAIERGANGLTLTLVPGYDFQSPTPPHALDGVLALKDRAYEIHAVRGAPPVGAAGLGPPPARGGGGSGGLGLASAAVFALLGGLILNLMPCVFPILAMKAASLAGHAAAGAEARRQGLAFGAGVIITFLALAGGLIALRAAGSAVGWGFQLQDPQVVGALSLLMLLVGLNLSGVFEVGTSLQGAGSGLAARGGLAGGFFTGVLAVVVAAPCTAPFMGPAMGWALTQPPAAALVVFTALAIGFAAPFVAVAFAPALLSRLPRPGAWMETFRKALAFPMYGAAAWLLWVLAIQAGEAGLARFLAAAVILALAAWLTGLAQRRRSLGGHALVPGVIAAGLAVLAFSAAVTVRAADAESSAATELTSDSYSPAKLAELRAQGRPVLVNYTAAWCVSCQVNDRVALSTRGVADALARANGAYLKADWTKRDPEIAAELASYGRAGVPLYLVYGAKGGAPVILPSLLTEGIVVRAIEAAKAG
ncbi:protein-disulfide reductase DsbD family protein [Phenylobacterium immobile]|uniref:protein-disulfide reductase DsbD family protein n=1 Tax=Phenylobacterium immobile TaxID=21 RepID=UPI000AB79F6E|nr:protein-disulfide reductase DsbD domain-containing protein [Phenylobacterium immobile]